MAECLQCWRMFLLCHCATISGDTDQSLICFCHFWNQGFCSWTNCCCFGTVWYGPAFFEGRFSTQIRNRRPQQSGLPATPCLGRVAQGLRICFQISLSFRNAKVKWQIWTAWISNVRLAGFADKFKNTRKVKDQSRLRAQKKRIPSALFLQTFLSEPDLGVGRAE